MLHGPSPPFAVSLSLQPTSLGVHTPQTTTHVSEHNTEGTITTSIVEQSLVIRESTTDDASLVTEVPQPTRARRKSLSEQLWGNVPAKVDSNRRPSVIQNTGTIEILTSAEASAEESGFAAPEGARRERRLSLQGA